MIHKISTTDLVDPALFHDSLALINLSIAKKDDSFFDLKKLAEPSEIRRQLANQLIIEPGCDIRTQAAYLINRLSWDLVCIIGFLDLNRLSLDSVWEQDIGVADVWESYIHEGNELKYTVYKWQLDELHARPKQSNATVIGQQLIELMMPFIDAVYHETRLSKGAQWRLVTDSISAVYLYAGKEFNDVKGAMARAINIIDSIGKPLTNKQWHFKEFHVSADASPTLKAISEWFRIRGGCCRYYTTPGGEYCSTCVHLDDAEQQKRFENYLIEQAAAAAITLTEDII
jgi:hypothetical protein